MNTIPTSLVWTLISYILWCRHSCYVIRFASISILFSLLSYIFSYGCFDCMAVVFHCAIARIRSIVHSHYFTTEFLVCWLTRPEQCFWSNKQKRKKSTNKKKEKISSNFDAIKITETARDDYPLCTLCSFMNVCFGKLQKNRNKFGPT